MPEFLLKYTICLGKNNIEQLENCELTYIGSSLPVKSTSETSVLAPVLVLKWENFSFFYPDRSSQCQKSHNFHTKLFVRAAHRTHPYQSPLCDIFFLGPHDITRYFGFWYDYHTILHDISHLVKYARKSQKLRNFREIREKTVQYTKHHYMIKYCVILSKKNAIAIFWKSQDISITIYHQTICWSLL